jgi:hypothetical protein
MTALIAALLISPLQGAESPLAGFWSVDLSTDPAQPYVKSMELRLASDGTVTGSFYGSEIQTGRWRIQNGRTCASFRTTDGAGPYHTAVCQVGASVEGQTWAEHRNFVFVWRAERTPGVSAPAAD